ncbi:hypothetical protein [Aquabacterium humicola]|uniref:hypothetical protein n=1 Tax=Aquabacterium humicola TaxID=3237377 RepID=UPI00254362CC|nr:hypothetical protein [Rubrivivax pictus]
MNDYDRPCKWVMPLEPYARFGLPLSLVPANREDSQCDPEDKHAQPHEREPAEDERLQNLHDALLSSGLEY